MMEVYLSGLGKYHKKGWFSCMVIKENIRTKIVRIPELRDLVIKVRNYKLKEYKIEKTKEEKNMKYLVYLRYLLRHKWYVMRECFKEGLYWRGLVHDLSKILPSEMKSYSRYFYGKYPDAKNDIEKEIINDEFSVGWLKHQKRNKHHWQYWVLLNDVEDKKRSDDKIQYLPMPERYAIEMICDWRGASMAKHGKDNTLNWYDRKEVRLHPDTMKFVEDKIGYKHEGN